MDWLDDRTGDILLVRVDLVPIKRRPKMTMRDGYPHVYTPKPTFKEEVAVAQAYRAAGGKHFKGAVSLELTYPPLDKEESL